MVAKHVLLQHQIRVIQGINEEDKQRISVRRSYLWPDVVRAFSKSSFDVSKMLKVRFVGEPSVDEGGPRREFFQLAVKDALSSELFEGWPSNVTFCYNIEAVANNTYYIVGKLISTCLVQGGQPPACFSTDYLVYGRVMCEANLSDISDCDIKQKLEKVSKFCAKCNVVILGYC